VELPDVVCVPENDAVDDGEPVLDDDPDPEAEEVGVDDTLPLAVPLALKVPVALKLCVAVPLAE
jgi:hypothetical protein